jgi:2-dehydropantoate 2-reductase
MCAVSYVQPGEVTVQFPGWLVAGEPFSPPRERTRAIVRTLNASVPAYLTPHLERVRWSKLISNLNNALCAATGLLLSEIMQHPAGRALPVQLMKEGCAVTRAAGIRLDHGLYGLSPRTLRRDPTAALIALLQSSMTTLLSTLPEERAVALMATAGRSRLNRLPIRFSTWQSIARGRPTEIDYLNGEIVRLGQRVGVPTPLNSRLVDLVHEVERTGTFYQVEDLPPDRAEHPAAASVGGAP